jgi:uncharacterized membrane protein
MIRVFWFIVLISSPILGAHIYRNGIDDIANAVYYIACAFILLLILLIPLINTFLSSAEEKRKLKRERDKEDNRFRKILRANEAKERDYKIRLEEAYGAKEDDINSILDNEGADWVQTKYGLLPIEITEEQFKKLTFNKLGQKELYELTFNEADENVTYIYRLKTEKKEKPVFENVIEFDL